MKSFRRFLEVIETDNAIKIAEELKLSKLSENLQKMKLVELFEKTFKNLEDIPDENKNGDCYKLAFDYFAINNSKNKDLFLAHGLVTGQGNIEGIVYNHAWCEDNHYVYDLTLPKDLQKLPKSFYYKIGKIKTVYRYKKEEVLKNIEKYKTYGPWENKLKKNKF